MVRTHPARRERDERQPEQEMQIRPEDRPRDGMRRMQHMVVVIPIDAKIDEAQHVAQEDGDHGHQRLNALALGHLHLQHHDGDEDGDHAITERFQPILSHAACTRAQALSMTPLQWSRCTSVSPLRGMQEHDAYEGIEPAESVKHAVKHTACIPKEDSGRGESDTPPPRAIFSSPMPAMMPRIPPPRLNKAASRISMARAA